MMVPLLELPLQRVIIDGGIEIHYAEAGEGPPLVFVHGAGGGGWEWAVWARVFAAAGIAVAAPDLRPAAAGLG